MEKEGMATTEGLAKRRNDEKRRERRKEGWREGERK